MARSPARRGSLPNGRPDKETMRFRYEMLKALQSKVKTEDIERIVERAIFDAIAGDPEARSWLSTYVLPKQLPIAEADVAIGSQVINNYVLQASDAELEMLAGLEITTIDVEASDARSLPDPESSRS